MMITGTPAPRLFHFSEEPDIAEFAPRMAPRLTPLETTTMHWSAIRMRNAQDWPR